MDRPSPSTIAHTYREIFGPEWTIQKLSNSAIQGHLLKKAVHEPPGAELVGRSIVWKLLLAADSPLDASTGLQELRRLRAEYVRLLKDSMRAPDGTFPDTLIVPGEPAPRRTTVNANLAQNNPLSLDESNPWQDYFASLELRKTIAKDVERTFPDVDYFRSSNAQRMLADVLFVYTKVHDGVSYRQGMHELLAPVLWALDYDSLDGQEEDTEMHEFLSRDYVPADAWAIFTRIMAGAEVWYEWREPTPLVNTTQAPWVAPINLICAKIGGEYLKVCDPALAARLEELGIEPQMYGIRWLRLLFTREFSWRDALVLWDALFAADSSLQLAQWICIAMLIRIRNLLIPAEYTTALTHVLRYPPPPCVPPSDTPLIEPHILVQQALMLRATPTPATGATVVLQNRSALGIPIEAPPPPPPPTPRARGTRGRRRSVGGDGNGPPRAGIGLGGSRHGTENSLSGLAAFALGERADVIAKGFWDIGGTVQNRVSEIRRNLPDLVRTPSTTADAHVFPYYQAIANPDPDPIDDVVVRPSLESRPSAGAVRSRFEVEREVGDAKLLMKRLGEGVKAALAALGTEDRKEEALESLSYIQEVLSGSIEPNAVDPEKVLGRTEYMRRKEERERIVRERAEREREQAEREQSEKAREEEHLAREGERQRQKDEQERQMAEQDPLQTSPSVRPAPLLHASPPRIRTTRAPWERSEHTSIAGRVAHSLPARTHTPPSHQKPVATMAPPPRSQLPPSKEKKGPSDSLGLGPLG